MTRKQKLVELPGTDLILRCTFSVYLKKKKQIKTPSRATVGRNRGAEGWPLPSQEMRGILLRKCMTRLLSWIMELDEFLW